MQGAKRFKYPYPVKVRSRRPRDQALRCGVTGQEDELYMDNQSFTSTN